MQTDSLFVNELRALFKAGTTPSALVRAVAERHAGESEIDRLVRAYFREAFLVPMLQIGPEGVERVVAGCGAPALDAAVIHLMVATRDEWDTPPARGEASPASWLDSVTATDEAEMLRATEAGMRPESVPGWERLDDEGRQFIARTIANAHSLYERVRILAALAQRLQNQLDIAGVPRE